MRGFFSGNRHSAPLGPPKAAGAPPASVTKGETVQALRQRQREKRRQLLLQMMRAEKERELAQQQGDDAKVRDAEGARRALSDAAEALSAQVATLERIMEEVGLTVEIEEDQRADQEMLEESREQYEQGLAAADEQIREHMAQGEYMTTMASPFMMPSDVYDEDEAMRDLDETAKQTGRA